MRAFQKEKEGNAESSNAGPVSRVLGLERAALLLSVSRKEDMRWIACYSRIRETKRIPEYADGVVRGVHETIRREVATLKRE